MINRPKTPLSFEWTLLIGSLGILGCGLAVQNPWLTVGGGIALGVACWMHRRVESASHPVDPAAMATQLAKSDWPATPPEDEPPAEPTHPRRKMPAIPSASRTDTYVEEMIQQGRYALLLRPEVRRNLTETQHRAVVEILEDEMALIGEGQVNMETPDAVDYVPSSSFNPCVHADAVHIDRLVVTNEAYQQFVDDGGYEIREVWDDAVYDGVRQFVDSTGAPGPKYWADGRYPKSRAEHPVVGVCWYEAAAYARWAGKRLPTDAEWVRTATSPVSMGNGAVQQRKYPWGDAIDDSRANLWLSGMGRTAPVTAFAGGDSVLGVRQLVGNVWEWTTDPFGCWSPNPFWRDARTEHRAVRGGAFNTYFESQAAPTFQSGDHPLMRNDNIGFRCALSASDVTDNVTKAHTEMVTS